jgi:hypothetical protein
MRNKSVFSVTFSADSDVEASEVAKRHHEKLRDELFIEGADHPTAISLKHLYAENRDILADPQHKSLSN